MAVKVIFRFNKLTGEVEEFLVEQDQEQPRERHDQAHEQVAGELGRLIERFPRVMELTGVTAQVDLEERSKTGGESTDEKSRARPEVHRRR